MSSPDTLFMPESVRQIDNSACIIDFDCGDADLNDTKAGCRFITVDAYREAIPFYEKNGFVPLNQDDADDVTRVLYFDLMDLED